MYFIILAAAVLTVLAIINTFMHGVVQDENSVVVYTSVDMNFSEKVFKDFEAKTNIKVIPAYDTEASKTTGMVNKIIEEKSNPRCDVFWNGEFAQTIILKEKDALMPYKSINSESIPDNFKDTDGYWTAFGGRARCILVNKNLLLKSDYPKSINDFYNEKYPADKVAMAYPLFGTTATYSAALFADLGEEKSLELFNKLKNRGIRIVDGNSVVRDLVADGQLMFGMTDTDDAIESLQKGKPVDIIFPDQENGRGTLINPNSAAIIKNCKHPDNAKQFIDYLLSESTEKYLLEIGWCQNTVRKIDVSSKWFDPGNIITMKVSLTDIYKNIDKCSEKLKDIFIR